ncbi:MAG: thioredoxin family protein [Verrucomicrobiae bacterium]|nr:thioredoxin family protein [Verrucomicrobiae bacterium]
MGRFLVVIAVLALAFYVLRGRNGGGAVGFPRAVISQPTAAKSVPADNRIQVILFTGTEWCPACQQLDRSVIKTPAWQEFVAKEIQFRSFDFSADQSQVPDLYRRMASQYNVRGYPTMLVLDRNHEVLSRQVGSGPPVENWKAWIRGHEKFYHPDAS